MKQTSNGSDATDLGQADASQAGDLPVELKPGVMGTVVVRMLNGQSPLGRPRGARFFADDVDGGGLIDGFGEEEEEDLDEEEEDFEEEDEFADEEDEDFDDEEDDEDEESDEEDEDFDDEEEGDEEFAEEDEEEDELDEEV